MYNQRKAALQLVLIIACALGGSVASLSGSLAALSARAPAAAPVTR